MIAGGATVLFFFSPIRQARGFISPGLTVADRIWSSGFHSGDGLGCLGVLLSYAVVVGVSTVCWMPLVGMANAVYLFCRQRRCVPPCDHRHGRA
jgi:hypothetical protein